MDLLPLAGPIIGAATASDPSAALFYALQGACQIAGTVLIVLGFSLRSEVVVPRIPFGDDDDAPALTVLPTKVGSGYGVGVSIAGF